ILEDRPAQRESVLLLFELGEVRLAAGQTLAAGISVSRTMELVGAGLRDRVDQQSTEVALAHIERRQQHLVLLHRIERDRLGICLRSGLAGRTEAEQIAGSGAVDLDRVLADVDAAAGKSDARRG